MPMTIDQIVLETNQWAVELMADLVDRLTLAKHEGLTAEREAAWADSAAQRSGEIDSGKEKLIPGNEVIDRVRKIVGW